MTANYHGSCLCNAVTYEISGTFEHFYLCHCSYCQKDTGSAHAANLFSTNAVISWLTGKDNVQTYQLPSTRHVKSFCKSCGSALPVEASNASFLLVPAGSLDSDVDIAPDANIFMASKANWDKNLAAIVGFDRFPE